MSCDGLGHPVELVLTAAQESDITQAGFLLAEHRPEAAIAASGLRQEGAGRGGRAARRRGGDPDAEGPEGAAGGSFRGNGWRYPGDIRLGPRE